MERAWGYIRLMKGSWVARLKTALLAAVILSGGGGMPLLDLALYHGLTPDRSAPHFESRTPHSHGDSCRLSSSLSHCPQVAALDLDFPAAAFSDSQPTVPLSAPRIAHPGLHTARAPPSLSASPRP